MKNEIEFCDLHCRYAEFPKEEAVDGSGSCRTFIGLHCTLQKTLVAKNKICRFKEYREEPGQK